MYWDWVEASSSSKEITTQACLPSNASTYGKLQIVDNACPITQRTFTANALTASAVNTIIAQSKVRNRCFRITTSLGTTYVGRYISYSAQQTRGADHWQFSMVLQDIDDELPGTPQEIYTLSDTSDA